MANYSYPLDLPPSPDFSMSSWSIMRGTGLTQSTFTGKQQVSQFNIALWSADLELPPMKIDQARKWQAFFMKLKGRFGTFLLSDPDYKLPQGTARDGDLTLSSQLDARDSTVEMTSQSSVTLLAGDYVQIGDQLHMVVDDVTISGATDVNVEPFAKKVTASGEAVIVESPKAKFRLSQDMSSWSANHLSNYGIKFSCIEAV